MSRYRFIQQHRGQYALRRMCRVLDVSRSGYYAWLTRPLSGRAREDGILVGAIRAVHKRSHGTYGSPRVHQALVKLKYRCGRHRVARLMRQVGLHGVPRARKRRTTKPVAGRPVAPDRLQRDFTADRPNQKWVADITYIPTREGWLYLAVVMDLFSRRIVGWSMEQRMTDELVIQALGMAVVGRRLSEELIHHSDRGGQYTSASTQALLDQHHIQASMGSRGDCYDNAAIESFLASLKRERTHGRTYAARSEARLDLFWYIEAFYNRERLHSTLGFLSPAEYEERHANTP